MGARRVGLGLLLFAAAGCVSSPSAGQSRPNAAVGYTRAFDLLDQAGESKKRVLDEASPLIGRGLTYEPAEWEGALNACIPALKEMERASSLGFCRFGATEELDQDRPWVGRARELARINAVWAWHQVLAGDQMEALASWRRGFALASHIASEEDFIHGLVGLAIASITMENIRRSVVEDRLEDRILKGARALLDGQPYGIISLAPGIRGEQRTFALAGERWLATDDPLVAWDEYIQSQWLPGRRKNLLDDFPARGRQLLWWQVPLDLWWDDETTRAIFESELRYLLATLETLESWAGVPYVEVRSGLLRFEKQCDPDDKSFRFRHHLMTIILAPALCTAIKSRMKSESQRRGLLGLISIRLFLREHSRLPGPDDSIPLPDDPCTGRPMVLERTSTELLFRCEIDERKSDLAHTDPFHAGVFKLPIPEELRGR